MGWVNISGPPPSPPLHSSSPPLPLLSLFRARRRRGVPIRSLTPCPSSIGRVTCIATKCFSANADIDVDTGVDVKQAATEHGDSEDQSSISSGRSIPTVHLKSNILETDSVNLLERNYADKLLTALPVLTEEQQNELAATPAHPAGLYALYVSVLVGNFVEQLWNFAWPSAVALIHPSLLPVAVVSFFTKLTTFIAGPLVGNVIDSVPRIPAYNCLNLVQAGAQLLSAVMIIFALRATRYASASTVLLQPWFIVLVGAAAIERLSGLAFGVMVERDWVVLLAGTNRAISLAQANAMLSRVDMFCEIGGASLFGILLSKYDPVTCLKFAAGLMISTLPLLILLGRLTNKLSSGVLDCPKYSQGYDGYLRNNTLQKIEKIVESGVHAIRHGWMEYKNQPVLPASIAYVMLFFNIALAPGAMMTTFLTHKGISPSIIGAFSGSCAFMGVAATFMSTTLVKKLSILRAGAAGLIFQSSLLITAVAVLWGGLHLGNVTLHFFLVLVALSRLGHMSYDVIGTQILQTGIPANKANLIGATEISIASLAEFVMLGVAIIANDVSHFGILALLSVSSVVGATWLFCHWLTKPSDEQRRLFSYGS